MSKPTRNKPAVARPFAVVAIDVDEHDIVRGIYKLGHYATVRKAIEAKDDQTAFDPREIVDIVDRANWPVDIDGKRFGDQPYRVGSPARKAPMILGEPA